MKFQLNRKYISRIFIQKLSPELVTIILNDLSEFPLLRDNMGYLAIKLVMKKTQKFDMLLLKFQNDESICCFAFRG
jgi:polyphosphate kinase